MTVYEQVLGKAAVPIDAASDGDCTEELEPAAGTRA
jgi:hypothetical protein